MSDRLEASVQAVQWCPDGQPLNGRPGQVMRLLAEGGKTFGYGYGPGWSMMFGTAHGDITVQPGQWVIRHHDGTITVQNDPPEGDREP